MTAHPAKFTKIILEQAAPYLKDADKLEDRLAENPWLAKLRKVGKPSIAIRRVG